LIALEGINLPYHSVWHRNPKNILHQLDNLGIVLELLKQYGINLVGVIAEDVCGSNNENMVILILVALIKKFQNRKNLSPDMSELINNNESSTFKKFHMKGDIIHEEQEESPEENNYSGPVDVALPTVEIAQIILFRLTSLTEPTPSLPQLPHQPSQPSLHQGSAPALFNNHTPIKLGDKKKNYLGRTSSLSALEDKVAPKQRLQSVSAIPDTDHSPEVSTQWERTHKPTSPEEERTPTVEAKKNEKIVLGTRKTLSRNDMTRSWTSPSRDPDDMLEIDLSVTVPGETNSPAAPVVNQSCRKLFGELDDLLGDLLDELNN